MTIGIIALIVALSGGAFAASHQGAAAASKKAKAKPGPRGPKGVTGATGAQGPVGSQGAPGAAGAKGDKGDIGTTGATGTTGAAGKSVTVTEVEPEEPECEGRGGAIVEKEGSPPGVEVCSGKEGKEGSPWTDNGTLPPGATETGAWSFTASEDDVGAFETGLWVPISFPIPLAEGLEPSHVHYGLEGAEPFSQACPGGPFHPTAKPGELCVYEEPGLPVIGTTFKGIYFNSVLEGTGTAGAILNFTPPTEAAIGGGSFAVTGCKEGSGPFQCP